MTQAPPPVAVETQLVLVTPVMEAVEPLLPRLEAALAQGPVAAVIARLVPGDLRGEVNRVKALATVVQAAGAALMVEASVEAAARGGADGLHLAFDAERLAEALERLKPERMVGVGGLKSRDDAMTAGERGADYVMFGEPAVSRHAEKNGVLPPFAAVVERIGWWAEVFEVPVVGYAPDLASIGPLARAGADFVALADAAWQEPAAVAGAFAALAEARR